MNSTVLPAIASHATPGQLITCILPEDGTDHALLTKLKAEKGIITANSQSCQGISILSLVPNSGKGGKQPVAEGVRIVSVAVPEDQAEMLFEFICDNANIDRPSGGVVLMGPLHGFTTFTLPDGVQDEQG
ncbi:MAG: hypothetical protein HQM04_13055 [Magnetococcales bacterium]|nr:hypothetical protein [Magnetococcales bacterium]MBF0115955.1 hypothetical protein [Magnetococcales bacterium]